MEIISEDDGYEPDQAAANAKRFVSGNDVFAVIGGVGTPTAKRLAPILRAAGIPFVGPFTGADFLRAAKRFPNVVNLRAGYREETRLLVDYMINKLGKRRFGIIYQDDAFGYSVLANYDMILDSYGIPILAKAFYSRNSLAVHSSLFTFSKADLDAIMLVGASPSNSEIINLAHSLGHDYVMANLSFTESYDLRKRVDGSGKGILVSNVMIDPNSSEMRISKRFRSAIQSEHADLMVSAERLINETALEGYILGRFLIAVLERMDGDLTRERFLATALSPEPVRIDDWVIQFEPNTNTGSRYVRLSELSDYNKREDR